MLRIAFAAILAWTPLATAESPLRAPASPGASIVFGHARITILTSELARVEYSADLDFDDRPSTFIQNRSLPVPAYNVSHPNASSIRVETVDMVVTYVEAPLPPPPARRIGAVYGGGITCLGGYNVPQYPAGAQATRTQEACAALCAATVGCEGAYFDPGPSDPLATLCFPRAGVLNVRYTGAGESSWTPVARATGPFSRGTLRVDALGGTGASWSPGDVSAALNGTFSQLDCGYGAMDVMGCISEWWAMRMQRGLVSDGGIVAVDDSWTLRVESRALDSGWAAPRGYAGGATATPDNTADLYISVYGARRDYAGALGAWAALSGPPALPRRAYLGIGYSRYWPYSEAGVLGPDGVLEGYANHSLPLSLYVLDMDWHVEPHAPCSSWGQYDWNTSLFADPVAFLGAMHAGQTPVARPLEVALNFHMQSGVDKCAARYGAVAAALGLPPGGNATIACDFFNASYVAALRTVYFDAPPLDALDLPWADWFGCGTPTGSVAAAQTGQALLWTNTLLARWNGNSTPGRRPMQFARNGGFGSQRLPISFSGDTYQHEAALDFLVDTTPTAANALLPYWSHDVGGFMNSTAGGAPGDWDAANFTGLVLMLRWFQAAVTQPIFRTHCDHCVRTIWSFPAVYAPLADALALRHALGAYLYTAARAAYDTGVSPMRPMYYAFPSDPLAHDRVAASRQYLVGEQILAAPFATVEWAGNGGAADNTTARSVWLPQGSAWAAWEGSAGPLRGAGPKSQVTVRGGLSYTPLFIPFPSLLPLVAPDPANGALASPDLVWTFWPPYGEEGGGGAEAEVYEDDGETRAYEAPGAGMRVAAAAAYGPGAGNVTLTVQAPAGTYAGRRPTRAHSLQVRGWAAAGLPPPQTVAVNGAAAPRIPEGSAVAPGWYLVEAGTSAGPLVRPLGCLVVNGGAQPVGAGVVVVVAA